MKGRMVLAIRLIGLLAGFVSVALLGTSLGGLAFGLWPNDPQFPDGIMRGMFCVALICDAGLCLALRRRFPAFAGAFLAGALLMGAASNSFLGPVVDETLGP